MSKPTIPTKPATLPPNLKPSAPPQTEVVKVEKDEPRREDRSLVAADGMPLKDR
jgi:hypothetical protein